MSTSQPRRVIVITGAGGTLGAELSRQFVGEPDTDVVLSDVSESGLVASVNGLPERRGAVETLPADVSEVAEVEAVVSLAVERFGRLDVLISNAGVLAPNGRIHNLATEDWSARSASTSSVPSTASAPRCRSCARNSPGRSS